MKYSAFIDNVATSNSTAEPTVEIRGYKIAGEGMARVVADVFHTAESRADHALVIKVLNKKLKNAMVAVANTFKSVDRSEFVERITGLLSVNKQSVVVSGEMKGFRAIASNMFMDEEEGMWVLRKTEAGDILIKSTGVEDDTSLVGLLQSVCSAGGNQATTFASLSAYSAPRVQGGDCVTYIGVDNKSTLGFVVATVADSSDIIVQAFGVADPETITNDAITEVHDTEEMPDDEAGVEENVDVAVASARGVSSLADIAAYYKRVFARNPKYYAEFAKRLNSHKFC